MYKREKDITERSERSSVTASGASYHVSGTNSEVGFLFFCCFLGIGKVMPPDIAVDPPATQRDCYATIGFDGIRVGS